MIYHNRTIAKKFGFCVVLFFCLNSKITAQTSDGVSTGSDLSSPVPTPTKTPVIPVQPTPKTYTNADLRKYCGQYEGRYISYYGDVFKVQNCERRRIMSADTIFNLSRKRIKIENVDATPIAIIPEGKHLDQETGSLTHRKCADLNGRFVTFSYTEIFLVEKCKKRLIPDWFTFQSYEQKRSGAQKEILALTSEEFNSLQPGDEITSAVDKEYARAEGDEAPPEIIPIDEACKGVDGKIVSFYSKIYKIEKCRKREYDPQAYSQNRANQGKKVTPLSAEQWLSLPDGKPMPTEEKDTSKVNKKPL